MLTTERRSSMMSLSGGHIVSDQSFKLPSYSPNALSAQQSFPWEESVDDINTPDIDPSFFDNDPFKKSFNGQMDISDKLSFNTDNFLITTTDPSLTSEDEMTMTHESVEQLSQPSLEDNYDLSALINAATTATTPDNESLTFTVSPNDVLANQYIPATTAPVLHYMQPRLIESVASTINYEDLTSTVDSLTQQYTTTTSQSYSPVLSTVTYLSPSPSPALSYTSTSTLVSGIDAFNSDTNQSLVESKPELDFLQPTVINDHLYTRPTKSSNKRRRSSEKGSQRDKNNVASKKSRVSKRDKQKQMDEQIQHYLADNASCKKQIETMEKQIQWCKDYLFKKVVASAKP